ncbi:MAG: NAD-dependent epimerase/dehydratase family protein [Burkholderiaceae bacterium]
MKTVLVCGAGGFVGRQIVQALRTAGLAVIEGLSADQNFARDVDVPTWLPRLDGVDAVINAVGVLRDSAGRPMDAVHHRAPAALFQACAERGLRRVIQISALGIAGSQTLYARSKRAGDEALLSLRAQGRLDGVVLRPSIVFGRAGASSQLFMRLAGLPLLVLPAAALRARVQPLAVQDLGLACLRLLQLEGRDTPALQPAVGPQALSVADFIQALRRQQGHGAARVLALPEAPSRWSARLGDHLPFQPWCSETLVLLQQDNCGDAAGFQALLGRPAVAPEKLVAQAWQQ